jgi:hypothetical protein
MVEKLSARVIKAYVTFGSMHTAKPGVTLTTMTTPGKGVGIFI